MKKLISSILCLAMTCALFVPAGAVETVTVTVNAAAASSGDSVLSNRYDYVTVKGTEKLAVSHVKTPEDLQDEEAYMNAAKKAIKALLAATGPGFDPDANDVADMFADMAFAMNGLGSKGKIEIYTRMDTRYRVDSLTGERVAERYTYYLIYKVYVDNGNGYDHLKTQQFIDHTR